MSLALYMDVHVPQAITVELRRRGVDVITAQEDGTNRPRDPELLDRAQALGRVLFTFDDDLLVEAKRRQHQQKSAPFAGVVDAHPLRVSIGACGRDLELLAKAGEPGDLAGQIEFLPR